MNVGFRELQRLQSVEFYLDYEDVVGEPCVEQLRLLFETAAEWLGQEAQRDISVVLGIRFEEAGLSAAAAPPDRWVEGHNATLLLTVE